MKKGDVRKKLKDVEKREIIKWTVHFLPFLIKGMLQKHLNFVLYLPAL